MNAIDIGRLQSDYERETGGKTLHASAIRRCLEAQAAPPAHVEADVVELERLEELRRKATPGRWWDENSGGVGIYGDSSGDGGRIISGLDGYHVSLEPIDRKQAMADAKYIAALHNAWPALFAELRALRAALAKHGRHSQSCAKFPDSIVNPRPCDCGLSEALHVD